MIRIGLTAIRRRASLCACGWKCATSVFTKMIDVYKRQGVPSDLLHISAPVEQALTADGPVFPQYFVAEIAVGENDFIHERIFMQHQGVHIML